jgi:hypothetical protein
MARAAAAANSAFSTLWGPRSRTCAGSSVCGAGGCIATSSLVWLAKIRSFAAR